MSWGSPTTPQIPNVHPQVSPSIPGTTAQQEDQEQEGHATRSDLDAESISSAATTSTIPSANTGSCMAATAHTPLNATQPRIHLHIRRSVPALTPILTRLRYPLAPLRPLPAGPPHPSFPATLLSYHLLAEEQLDSIALYYHQRPGPTSPSRIWTDGYPANMHWDDEFLVHLGEEKGNEARIGAKRRKVGRFAGLRGCQTPEDEVEMSQRWSRKKEESRMKGAEDWLGRSGWGM